MPKYNVIENFKAGLDTRKSVLTSVPGSLVTLENAHVNQGGEVEKRQKFVADATPFHADTFGFEAVSTGFVTFCSADPTGWTAPTGVTYQRLRHPAALYGGTDSAMTSVPFSLNFNGKAFVAATFADGNTFLYYNGTLVDQSWEGTVLAGRESLATFGTDLKRAVEREEPDWSVDANANGDGWDYVTSPAGIYMNPVATWKSTLGYLAATENAKDGAGTNGTGAYWAFQISVLAAGSTFTVSAPRQKAGGAPYYTLANAVPAAATAALTATAIAAAINATTSATGYLAYVDSVNTDTFVVFAPVEWGNCTVVVTVDWTGASTVAEGTFTGTLLAQCPDVRGYHHSIYDVYASYGVAYPVISGIHPPFTCAWAEVAGKNPNAIQIFGAASLNPTFMKWFPPGLLMVGTFRLTVTDASMNTATVDVNVYLL